MKKALLVLFLISNLAYGQTSEKVNNEEYKENLNKSFIEYNDLILSQDFEKAMTFMLPEFFDIIPKNQMILLMKRTYNNPDLEFKADKPKNIKFGELKQIEEKFYSEINYDYDIKIKFNNVEKSEDEEQNKLTLNLMKLNLEKTFGSGNVKYNKETEFYDINSNKNAIGISKDGVNNWKFLVVEKKQKFILEKILPKEITEKI